MTDGDIVFNTLRKWIRCDREMSEALSSLGVIQNAEKYLSTASKTRGNTSEGDEGGGGEESGSRWMEMDGMSGPMTLREKTALMVLLREIMQCGGEIRDPEKMMEAIERVIAEGREREDEDGMNAEREGAFLQWMIEKKKRGGEMKTRREIEIEKEEQNRTIQIIEREKEEEKKKRVEAERREGEERRGREELESEIKQLRKDMKAQPVLITDVNETVVKIPNRQVVVQEGNTFRLNKQTDQTIIIGTKMQRVYIYSHSLIHLFITHTQLTE